MRRSQISAPTPSARHDRRHSTAIRVDDERPPEAPGPTGLASDEAWSPRGPVHRHRRGRANAETSRRVRRRRELLSRQRRCGRRELLSRRRRPRRCRMRGADRDRGQDPVRIADGHRAQAGAQARQLPPHQAPRRPASHGPRRLRPRGPGQGEGGARGAQHVRVRRRRGAARRRALVLQVGVRELEG